MAAVVERPGVARVHAWLTSTAAFAAASAAAAGAGAVDWAKVGAAATRAVQAKAAMAKIPEIERRGSMAVLLQNSTPETRIGCMASPGISHVSVRTRGGPA